MPESHYTGDELMKGFPPLGKPRFFRDLVTREDVGTGTAFVYNNTANMTKSQLPIWVLNLKTDKRRLRFMQKQLRALKLDFTVVEALDGSRLSPDDWKLYSKEKALKFSKRELTPGELGCALSHARMWERIVRENIPEVLIFEDDVLIGGAFPAILDHRDRFPVDWELINFSTDAPQEPFGKFITDIYRVSRHKDWADRASAYLINSKGAKKLLNHAYPIGHTADGLTWRTDITGVVSYGVYPRVVILSDLDSSIWSRGEISQPSWATRKHKEFIFMMKTISRFFGISQLFNELSRGKPRGIKDRNP
jgi:glycosyl transferase family 25